MASGAAQNQLSNTDADDGTQEWDGRIGDKMQSAIRNLAGNPYPSMHQLAIKVGPHGSTDFGYQIIHRCRKRDLITLDDEHPEASPKGRGAVVLTPKGRRYYNQVVDQ